MGNLSSECSCIYKQSNTTSEHNPIGLLGINIADQRQFLKKIILIQRNCKKYLIQKKKRFSYLYDENILTSLKIKKVLEFENDFTLDLKVKEILKELSVINPEKLQFCKKYLLTNDAIFFGKLNDKMQREGYGEILFSDGTFFQGFFKENLLNGKGRIIQPNNEFYEGEFKNGRANGFGRFKNSMVSYQGMWKNNYKHGIGKEIDEGNYIYDGEFVKGKKSGIGMISYIDNSVYKGSFLEDELNGKGTFIWSDGRKYKGEWKNSKIEGFGAFYWSNSKRYFGYFKDNKKSGNGVYFSEDGKIYQGGWFKGKQHGFGILNYQDIYIYGEWKFGNLIREIDKNSENFDLIFGKIKELRILYEEVVNKEN